MLRAARSAMKGVTRWEQQILAAATDELAVLEESQKPFLSPYMWRVQEDVELRKKVAAACGVRHQQIRLKMPASIVYDEQATSLLRLRANFNTYDEFQYFRGWFIPEMQQVLPWVHALQLRRYEPWAVLQEIYQANGGEGDFRAKSADTGPAMLKTFQMLGSVQAFEAGTCYVGDKHGWLKRSRKLPKVLVDAHFFHHLRYAELIYSEDPSIIMAKCPLLHTGYYLAAIPRAAFECPGGYTVKRADQPYHPSFAVRLHADMQLVVELAKQFKHEVVKSMVEIDRSMLGLNTLVFFMPDEAARDKAKVWEALSTAMQEGGSSSEGDQCLLAKALEGMTSLDGLKLFKAVGHPFISNPAHFYFMVPESFQPEHLPFFFDVQTVQGYFWDVERNVSCALVA